MQPKRVEGALLAEAPRIEPALTPGLEETRLEIPDSVLEPINQEKVVHITIGTVEVRAPNPSPPILPHARPGRRSRQSPMSLDAYLAKRKNGQGQ